MFTVAVALPVGAQSLPILPITNAPNRIASASLCSLTSGNWLNDEPVKSKERKYGMKKYLIMAASAALFINWTPICAAQSDAPYTEGAVWNITMVKTKPGMSDDYLKGIAKTFKGELDEAKKQNLIMDYKVLIGDAATSQDFDILLMVESANMAALDNAREKFDPISKKIGGSIEQQRTTATKRLDIREIIGVKLMREITLK